MKPLLRYWYFKGHVQRYKPQNHSWPKWPLERGSSNNEFVVLSVFGGNLWHFGLT
jgi:streptogramin lyase